MSGECSEITAKDAFDRGLFAPTVKLDLSLPDIGENGKVCTHESSHISCFIFYAYEISQHPAHEILSKDDYFLVKVLYASWITRKSRLGYFIADVLGECFWYFGTRQSS